MKAVAKKQATTGVQRDSSYSFKIPESSVNSKKIRRKKSVSKFVGSASVSLPIAQSERTIGTVAKRAIEVLGSEDEALRWLGSPIRALDFATPISLLASKHGIKRVYDVLGQMEYGVW